MAMRVKDLKRLLEDFEDEKPLLCAVWYKNKVKILDFESFTRHEGMILLNIFHETLLKKGVRNVERTKTT